MAPLLSDGAAQLPREPCQVGAVGNNYILHGSSMLNKEKDELCLLGATQREPGGSRTAVGGGSLPHPLHPNEGEEPAPTLLPCLAEQSQLAGTEESTPLLRLCWCKTSQEHLAASSPSRMVMVVMVVVLVAPRWVLCSPAVCMQVRVYPHALSILSSVCTHIHNACRVIGM